MKWLLSSGNRHSTIVISPSSLDNSHLSTRILSQKRMPLISPTTRLHIWNLQSVQQKTWRVGNHTVSLWPKSSWRRVLSVQIYACRFCCCRRIMTTSSGCPWYDLLKQPTVSGRSCERYYTTSTTIVHGRWTYKQEVTFSCFMSCLYFQLATYSILNPRTRSHTFLFYLCLHFQLAT